MSEHIVIRAARGRGIRVDDGTGAAEGRHPRIARVPGRRQDTLLSVRLPVVDFTLEAAKAWSRHNPRSGKSTLSVEHEVRLHLDAERLAGPVRIDSAMVEGVVVGGPVRDAGPARGPNLDAARRVAVTLVVIDYRVAVRHHPSVPLFAVITTGRGLVFRVLIDAEVGAAIGAGREGGIKVPAQRQEVALVARSITSNLNHPPCGIAVTA